MDIKSIRERATSWVGKYKYFALILLVGVGLMLIPGTKKEQTQITSIPQVQEETLDKELEAILSNIKGAGRVQVMLTVASGEQVIYQTDSSSADRQDTVIINGENRVQDGLVQQIISPTYRGAIVLCQGADSANVCFQSDRPGFQQDFRIENEMNGGIFMNKWKKNLMAASVLLVVCAGIYVNWMYSSAQNVADLTDKLDAETVLSENGVIMDTTVDNMNSNVTSDYFAAVRLSRQEARDSAVNLLQEAMSYGDANQQQESGEQLEKIVQTALCEAQIESLVIAKGYADCVAYMSDNGISVAVATPEGGMDNQDIAVIADIVLTQTEFSMADIRVVEVQ